MGADGGCGAAAAILRRSFLGSEVQWLGGPCEVNARKRTGVSCIATCNNVEGSSSFPLFLRTLPLQLAGCEDGFYDGRRAVRESI